MDPAADQPSARRRLRARRAAAPLRLLEQGENGIGDAAGTRLDLSGPAPIALMRLGRQDLAAGIRAIKAGARPSGLVTGLGESRDTTLNARRQSRELEVPWLPDPLLFRTALDGYRTSTTLQDLDYTPGRDSDPYTVDEFEDADLLRRVGRSVVGAQVDLLAGGAISGAFVVSGIDDPWLRVDQHLLRLGADAAAAWSVPLIAALPLRMVGFDELEAQRLLVRTLSARRPSAWLLMADGMSESSSVERIVATLRLALLLQQASAPVILARSGDLRRMFWAFGVAGAEFGLGRLLRFEVRDFRKSSRGPGPTPGPRFELPSLVSSVPFDHARRLFGAELVSEIDCSCPSCSAVSSVEARMAYAAEHDAHVVTAEATACRGLVPEERVDRLERALRSALTECAWADAVAPLGRLRKRLEHQLEVLQAAREAGLLEPARLAAELRLFE